MNQGCDCRAFSRQPKPVVINNRCKCSHDRFRHQHVTKTDGSCWESDCDCMQYAPVTVETVELPEVREHDWHHPAPYRGLVCRSCNLAHKNWVGEPCLGEAPTEPEICEIPHATAEEEDACEAERLKLSSPEEPECPTACREGHTYSGSCLNRSHGPRPGPCRCGCAAGAHMGRPTGCLDHGFHEYEPASTEKPDPEECQHPSRRVTGRRYDGPGGRKNWVYYRCLDCKETFKEEERRCNGCGHTEGEGCGCSEHDFVSVEHCDRCVTAIVPVPAGPPCEGCGQSDGYWFDRSVCEEPCGSMHDRCSNCGAVLGYCALEHPPQPERRPPLSVAYSTAGGHLYEVYVPGDASVTAEDGALIIQHPEAQVLAIVRVAPIKEGS
ncbi:hypothetical protein ACFUJU_07825 [Streptomyces sp. NPDC057235]|uniref:hypothetical protein n=1 Tax=Streptomyces sp. NPDC057235 TaxID=3346058 RepID=UPI00362B8895